jgi:hypothetical protein
MRLWSDGKREKEKGGRFSGGVLEWVFYMIEGKCQIAYKLIL